MSEIVSPGQRHVEAYQLRLAGHSWEDIAQAQGYTSSLVCQVEVERYVQTAMAKLDKKSRAEIRELELRRLDALQEPYWASALGGDIKSAELVLKIMAQRAKYISEPVDADQVTNTIVVAGTEKEFIAGVRSINSKKTGS